MFENEKTTGRLETWELPNKAISQVFICRNQETPVPSKTVMIIIPGNPGVLQFYKSFAKSVFNNAHQVRPTLNLDVIVLQHVGHSLTDFSASESHQESIVHSWNRYFDASGTPGPLSMDQQINHKLILFDHIRTLYPKDTRFILCGHSIGCFMTLAVLRHRSQVGNIEKAVLLFPAIKEIARTPNGRVMQWISMWGVRHVVAFIVMMMRLLLMGFPVILHTILEYFTGMTSYAIEITTTYLLFQQTGLHTLTLADWEMKQVLELDVDTIKRNHDKLVLYYGPNDQWADESHYKDMKVKFPDIEAILCKDNVQHGFVVHSSGFMAEKVVQWI
ncbi:hypothetical protein HDU79_007668 [Rhizoclosmatium sp. JEL0117]|nr:hypothetical protein HDU79_007668 [Rhizoclosmatium sp. JEL0117]